MGRLATLNQPLKDMNKLHLKLRFSWAFIGSFGLAAAGLAPGQSDDEEDDEIYTLSPFEVSAEDDAGYRATSTLAGTRIRTDIRDIASPISVVTKEFLEDTAARDNSGLLQYTTNTEVGGLGGNFGGFGSDQGLSEEGALLRPNSNTRVRGLDSADNTRNFSCLIFLGIPTT